MEALRQLKEGTLAGKIQRPDHHSSRMDAPNTPSPQHTQLLPK